MSAFPSTLPKSMRLPARCEPTVLDKERNFLIRFVGQSVKKLVSRDVDTPRYPAKRK